MNVDFTLSLAGLLVGLLVGMTGMGGGAILTPLLVLVFGVPPLAAVSSDLVTSLVMKPVGAAVHLRRRTADLGLVKWLAVGAVPAGFLGAMTIGLIGRSTGVQNGLRTVIGVALLGSLAASILRQLRDRRARPVAVTTTLAVHRGRTIVIGVIGGVAVGMTSVGAGSLVIALLLLAYPGLQPSRLVGTDIVQAIPLVAAAALGHLIFGEVSLSLTTSLLIGALPGVYLGARVSSRAPSGVTRPIIAAVLTASSLALLGLSTPVMLATALGAAVLTHRLARTRPQHGVPHRQGCDVTMDDHGLCGELAEGAGARLLEMQRATAATSRSGYSSSSRSSPEP